MYNMFLPVEAARLSNTFTNGLSKYTQTNMQVTLENGLYHVYSPPNLTVANDGNTMWGGLRINNTGITGSQILMKNHTYIIKFHAKGKCSRSPEKFRWSYNMGWEGDSALAPAPTNVSSNFIPNPFEGEMDCFYKFTVSDNIYKVCSKSFSSYVAGTSYLSYDHFCFNYNYGNTGELGVDLYLSNFRMYDLTNTAEKPQVLKVGVYKGNLVQDTEYPITSLFKDSDVQCHDFYEF